MSVPRIHFTKFDAALPWQEWFGQGRICIKYFCGKISTEQIVVLDLCGKNLTNQIVVLDFCGKNSTYRIVVNV